MALLSDWWWLDLLAVVAGLFGVLYLYFTINYSYWKKRGIPYLEPSFPFGNISEVLMGRKQIGVAFSELYFHFKDQKVCGVFQLHRPTLILRDLDVIKSVLIKDFAHFHDRGFYFDEENDPINAHLFMIGGQKWKNLRTKLTPAFTSGKMKMMFQSILECGQELQECVREVAKLGETINIKEVIARYSSDVIASCAFGIEGNCLKNPDAEFRQWGKKFVAPGFITVLGFLLNVMAPTLASIVKLGRLPVETANYFRTMIRDTIEHREKNVVTKKDFLQLMIQLKNNGYVEEEFGETSGPKYTDPDLLKKLTVDEIAAQAFVFFVAGFDTSSSTVSFCMYELALNHDIQSRVRRELDVVLAKHGGSLTYEALQEMEYLGLVVAETMRKYPSLPLLHRQCNKSITMADGTVVERGTPVVVPVYGLHHDPRFYPDPEKFDPQRFTAEQKSSRQHCTYMPFGEGPRMCIGMRFGYMQVKVAIISLLARYEFDVSENTRNPLVFDPLTLTLAPEGGLNLKIFKRTS